MLGPCSAPPPPGGASVLTIANVTAAAWSEGLPEPQHPVRFAKASCSGGLLPLSLNSEPRLPRSLSQGPDAVAVPCFCLILKCSACQNLCASKCIVLLQSGAVGCNLATSGNSSLSSQCPDPTDAEFPTHQEERRAKQLLQLPSLVSPLRPPPRLGTRSYRECIRPTSPVFLTQARVSLQPQGRAHTPHRGRESTPLCRRFLYGESRVHL